MKKMARAVLLLCLFLTSASGQSNYADRGLDVEYQGNGLPQEATLDGIVTRLDDLSDTIRTNRTTASLSCASRAMEVDLEFSEPFYGIVYADFSRQSACSFVGKGGLKYHYELPLTGCGTIQDPLRVFTNNILVRFHPSLELEGDEVKTIVCRYPEPIVPPPLAAPARISTPDVIPPAIPPERLAEPQILLMICALLFLAMMLLGVACSYFCLKQRNIKLIRRRRALSSGLGSEITGYSEQTIFVPPFEGLKIPRAHASPETSDTLPSDYPSESRSGSIISVIECPPVEPDLSSVYSDAHNAMDVDTFGLPTVIPRVDPCFDVAFKVKSPPKRSPAPSSIASSDDRSVANVLVAQERALTTILEKEEWRQSEMNKVTLAPNFESAPMDGPADATDAPIAEYAQVHKKPRDASPARSLESQARSVGEMVIKSSRPYVKGPDASFRVTTEIPERHLTERTLVLNEDIQLHTSNLRHQREDEETETMIIPREDRPIPPPKLQEVDDVYLKTIKETNIIDEEERIRRQLTEYHQRPKPMPNWDVAIRTIPPPPQPRSPSQSTNWDDTSLPPPEWNVEIRQYPPVYEPRTPSESTVWDAMSQPPNPPDWNVEIRQYPPVYEPRTPSESTNWDGASSSAAPPPDWNVEIRQYPPVYEPRTPSESTVWDDRMSRVSEQPPPPEFDVKVRQYPPVYEPRSPSESTVWDDRMSRVSEQPPPPDFDVKVRQYPPVYEPRSPSVSTVWDDRMSEQPAPPDFDVRVRQYPPVYPSRSPSVSTNWDDVRSGVTSIAAPPPATPPDFDVKVRQYPPVHPARTLSESTDAPSEYAPSVASEKPPNWDVLIRVLNPPPPSEPDTDDASSVLTVEDRQKWAQIITTESTLRTMLEEAVVYEDFERIRRDTRFQRVFEPRKWDVIIRILAPPRGNTPPRDDSSDSRSSSTADLHPIPPVRPHRRSPSDRGVNRTNVLESVRESFTSYDVSRSVNFSSTRYQQRNNYPIDDDVSESSSGPSGYPRSTADRSMGHSEMVERPMTYRPEWMDAGSDDGTSHRQSLARSTSEFTEEWPQRRLPFDRVSSTDGSEDYSEPRRPRPTLERSTTEVEEAVPQAEANKRQSSSSSSSAGSGDFNRRVPYERVPSSSGSEEGSSSRRRHQ